MIRLGGAASNAYLIAFPGIKEHFRKQGIDLDWVLYSDWDALVEAFVNKEIDLAWNGPLAYVKIKRRLADPCQVVAMRDTDVGLVTHFITGPNSDISKVEHLGGKRFAFGSRGSVETGLLAYHFLKEAGINPRNDLALCTFYEERQPSHLSGERDVVHRVMEREYDAGAVCQTTLVAMEMEGSMSRDAFRIFWTTPAYSHCCFTAQGEMNRSLSEKITRAFVSMDYKDAVGKQVMDAEGCRAFVPGIIEGWEALEKVALEEGLI